MKLEYQKFRGRVFAKFDVDIYLVCSPSRRGEGMDKFLEWEARVGEMVSLTIAG